ncbi:hypothetical protein LTS15_010124 [Exophiala xenobiotica]|nr:hypothetical protein LTS15_010124 [Exophiala xenobiotica]
MATPWLPSSQSGRLSFFDLATETRNQIYHHLFDGQLIHIREKDDPDEIEEQAEDCPNNHYKAPPAMWLMVRRNQAMGLNLLLASKQCLAEAKPILLGSATFTTPRQEDPSPQRLLEIEKSVSSTRLPILLGPVKRPPRKNARNG